MKVFESPVLVLFGVDKISRIIVHVFSEDLRQKGGWSEKVGKWRDRRIRVIWVIDSKIVLSTIYDRIYVEIRR